MYVEILYLIVIVLKVRTFVDIFLINKILSIKQPAWNYFFQWPSSYFPPAKPEVLSLGNPIVFLAFNPKYNNSWKISKIYYFEEWLLHSLATWLHAQRRKATAEEEKKNFPSEAAIDVNISDAL